MMCCLLRAASCVLHKRKVHLHVVEQVLALKDVVVESKITYARVPRNVEPNSLCVIRLTDFNRNDLSADRIS